MVRGDENRKLNVPGRSISKIYEKKSAMMAINDNQQHKEALTQIQAIAMEVTIQM